MAEVQQRKILGKLSTNVHKPITLAGKQHPVAVKPTTRTTQVVAKVSSTRTTSSTANASTSLSKTTSFSGPVENFDSRTVVSSNSISTNFSFKPATQPLARIQPSNHQTIPTQPIFTQQLFRAPATHSVAIQQPQIKNVQPVIPVQLSRPQPPVEELNCSDEETEDEMSIEQNSLENIDLGDEDDPQFVSTFVNDIFDFLYTKELEVQIPGNYFANLQSIQPKHRDIMANWISESAIRLKLLSETAFLAVNILDRVLSSVRVSRKKLSLVSVAALLIASKFEETYAPTLSDLHVLSENMFNDQQILDMERILLTKIDFNLCIPSPLHFLRRFSKAARSDSATHTLAKYICELSLLHSEMIQFLPSEVAAASVFVARKMKDVSPLWNSNLRHYTRLDEDKLVTCARLLNEIIMLHAKKKANEKNAIFVKYSARQLLSVALIPCVAI